MSGFANTGVRPFSLTGLISGFANIGSNLSGFFGSNVP
ncbi:PPE family domain protein [Mycobacterium ulcerans str. Harvey]|uniref:PPE family domain protein n=1 Tax=Mycobacterium ulcerans str. Harvey TaxID=1299332 RepID=A0ABN0R522_MYCUL|nr:PPE family domain protein [Mycobacterium ulcerans str. Harvey]